MKKEIVVGKIKRLISVIMLLTMLVMLTSCEHWMTKKAYKTEEFLFYNNTIIELREKALEQESLVIPKYLNGQEVYGIRDLRSYISGQRNININCENYNLKTLYLNEFMGKEQYSQYNWFTIKNLENIFIINNELQISGTEQILPYYSLGASAQNYFVSNYIKNNQNLTSERKEFLKAANLSFMYNYEGSPNYDYCFIDNTEDGKVNKPKYDPIREGYKFTGWYKDSECKEKFNFEEMIEIDTENYKENKIYAGWEEIV